MAEGELTAILYSLSNEMRAHDLQNLKHLCHGKIPLAELEKAQTSCDLFRIMRHKMLIRPGNLDYLESMLEKIGRADLARKIQTSGGDRTMQTESGLPSNPLVAVNYKGFLLALSDELTQDDVDALKFIADLPSGIDEKIEKGRDFFKHMMQAGTIGPTQLSHLADLLQKIHRMDLAVKVRKFQSTPEDNMRVTTVGGFNQTAAPQGNIQLPKPVIVEKQPTTHQMGGARSPSIPLMSPADFSRPRSSEPRFPVQAMPNPGELVDPLQAIGIDQEDEMPSYQMTQRPRGIALIISNEHFTGNPTLRDRQGNVKDVDHLQELWTFLNFHVVVRQELASQEIYSVMREFSTLDHSQYDCFVCCLLSHGANGGIFGTDSELVEIKDITALFKGVACPSLHNKPKLFFIQACRGQDFDRGAQIEMDATELNPEDSMRHSAEPNESHFLLGYATPPGYVSWRSQIHGSWYISKLCEVFRKYCDQFDVMTMMVKVNDEVSEAFTRQGYKQCPAPVVTLRRRIYFNNN